MNTISPDAASTSPVLGERQSEAPGPPRAAGRRGPWRAARRVALGGTIVLMAVVLVGLAWASAAHSIHAARAAAQANAEARLAGMALAMEYAWDRRLGAIDDLMRALRDRWQADPAGFDPAQWRRSAGALASLPLEVGLLDQTGGVIASTPRWRRGQSLALADFFTAQQHRWAGLSESTAIQWPKTGRWEITLSRRLDTADARFSGALIVAFDPWRIVRTLEPPELGPGGLAALLGEDGSLRPLGAPAGATPVWVGERAIPEPLRARAHAVWSGPSAIDGVARVQAFRQFTDDHFAVVLGLTRAVAQADAAVSVATDFWFAVAITLAVLKLAVLLLYALRAWSRRERRLAADRRALRASYAEARRAWAQAEAKTHQLEGVLAGMSDGVMVLDPELRVSLWNERFPQFTGVSESALRVGMPIEQMLRAQAEAGEFGPGDVEAAVRTQMEQLRAGGAPAVHQRTRPNGRSIERRRTGLPEGGFVTLYIDITARRQIEEDQAEARRLAEHAAAHKAEFVAVVSHEIRTPLNAVLGSLALLDRSGLTSPQRRLAEIARQGGDALLELIDDVLEMTRLEAGRLELRRAPFELRPLLVGVAEMMRPVAAERGLSLAVEIEPELPDWLLADAGRLRQIVMNFVANAAKYSAPGRIVLRAGWTRLDDAPFLRLAVRDEGPPIPPGETDKLFRPFSQLARAGERGELGSGLGLAICDRLARLMRGAVGVVPGAPAAGDAAGGGNEFWVCVPFEATPPPAPVAAGLEVRPRHRARVLLVEDIAPNHLVIALILRRGGHRVDVAENGADAIRLLAAAPYDLVFMDLVMPGMSGIEATRRMRALPGPAGRTPIVALTANAAAEDRRRCDEAGFDAVLAKPARPGVLLGMVEARATGSSRGGALAGPPPGGLAAGAGAAPLVLDAERLAELRAILETPALRGLVELCASELRDRAGALGEAVAGADAAAAIERAHGMAGVAATYGLAGVEQRTREIMTAARQGDWAAARPLADALPAELERALAALRAATGLVAVAPA